MRPPNNVYERRLDIAEATVRSHLLNIRRKLGVRRPEGVLLFAATGGSGLFFDDI